MELSLSVTIFEVNIHLIFSSKCHQDIIHTSFHKDYNFILTIIISLTKSLFWGKMLLVNNFSYFTLDSSISDGELYICCKSFRY